jgi:magnesium chelatase subunit H
VRCCAGCLHPDYDGYFGSPSEYLAWYAKHGALRDRPEAPTVAVLLYRKHVITQQGYIAQLVRCFEEDGVRPVPIFINGIEAHTVVGPHLSLLQSFCSAVWDI